MRKIKSRERALISLVCVIVLLCATVSIFAVKHAHKEEAYVPVAPAATPVPTPEPALTPRPLIDFTPVSSTSSVITGTSLMVRGEWASSYQADAEHTIDFGYPEDYAQIEGIVTFRGNNFRNSSSYGTARISSAKFGKSWSITTSGLPDNNGWVWSGSGWTGQPLAVQWPAETKRIMNMYDWAKEKDSLVEVIYATLGGRVYFLDLETGEKTRETLNLGFTFKGAGALDPRGYPLMYLGGGTKTADDRTPRLMVVSLIDGEVLFTTGVDDPLATWGWTAWDSSALVDAETDQLIYPGENGVLYILDLNTDYDPAAGTISVDPASVKMSYTTSFPYSNYYGMEDSAIVWRGHLFIADNRGNFLCINLNTMKIEWRFDCLDDTNCTGVLELDETGHPYIYLSTSFHKGWRANESAVIPVWKIDAVTGQEVWRQEYTCQTVEENSGGVQGSLSLGTGPLEGILYVPMGRHPGLTSGKLLALDTKTGEELWTLTSDSYAWSTPVTFYDTNGRGYVIYTSCEPGKMHLVDGLTGEVLDTLSFDCAVEATPIVYNNTVVIGTRGAEILGITLE